MSAVAEFSWEADPLIINIRVEHPDHATALAILTDLVVTYSSQVGLPTPPPPPEPRPPYAPS